MQKIIILACSLLSYMASLAIPAYPYPTEVTQPDGSLLTIRLHGDEFQNWTTTTDGYTVVRDQNGFFVYAKENGGILTATKTVAHNKADRNDKEVAFLKTTAKQLKPAISGNAAAMRMKSSQAVYKSNKVSRNYDYKKFRGLVILVEYKDRSFSRSDTYQLFDEMINKHDYDGFYSLTNPTQKIEYTGSVRDYFYDNSLGMFDPHFDIVGPVKIDYSQYYIHGATYFREIMNAALTAADDQVNFADYDTDNDGEVDMVFFVFAGGGSNFGGNNTGLLWPHAAELPWLSFDNKKMGRYACSTELYGSVSSGIIDGIGTICHEFSHVLGLMDEYDTDYKSSGGESVDPQGWSVMSSGSYMNNSRTPVGYSLFQRYQSGFSVPKTITEAGEYTLKSLAETGEGYRINSGGQNEYFLLENRQKSKWDAYLPGTGMLAFRVDSTNVEVWSNNTINCNPKHNYYELLRATPQPNDYNGIDDSEGDPFPGSGNVTELTNDTEPSLRTWTSLPSNIVLKGIAETDGIISFTAETEVTPTSIEDFESFDVASTGTLKGKFCDWNFEKATIADTEEGAGNGKRSAALTKGGFISTSVIPHNVDYFSFKVYSPSGLSMVQMKYSTDNGITWANPLNINGTAGILLGEGEAYQSTYKLELSQPAIFKIEQTMGSSSSYIDDITIRYEKGTELGSVEDIHENGFTVKTENNIITVSGAVENGDINVYELSGKLVKSVPVNGDNTTFTLPSKGFYIVTDGTNSAKLIL